MKQNKELIEKTDILQETDLIVKKTYLIMFTKDGLTATVDFQNGELIYEGNVPISESAKLLFESMKPYLTALQTEQAGVNGGLTDALQRISVLDYNDSSDLLDAVKIAKHALANAEFYKPELTQPELGINNSMEKTNVYQDVSNSKIVATFNDRRDEQIRILREGLDSVGGILRWMENDEANYSAEELRAMAKKGLLFNRQALEAANKLEATNANT